MPVKHAMPCMPQPSTHPSILPPRCTTGPREGREKGGKEGEQWEQGETRREKGEGGHRASKTGPVQRGKGSRGGGQRGRGERKRREERAGERERTALPPPPPHRQPATFWRKALLPERRPRCERVPRGRAAPPSGGPGRPRQGGGRGDIHSPGFSLFRDPGRRSGESRTLPGQRKPSSLWPHAKGLEGDSSHRVPKGAPSRAESR